MKIQAGIEAVRDLYSRARLSRREGRSRARNSMKPASASPTRSPSTKVRNITWAIWFSPAFRSMAKSEFAAPGKLPPAPCSTRTSTTSSSIPESSRLSPALLPLREDRPLPTAKSPGSEGRCDARFSISRVILSAGHTRNPTSWPPPRKFPPPSSHRLQKQNDAFRPLARMRFPARGVFRRRGFRLSGLGRASGSRRTRARGHRAFRQLFAPRSRASRSFRARFRRAARIHRNARIRKSALRREQRRPLLSLQG